MNEIISHLIESTISHESLALGTWFLFFVTSMDAGVGGRIYRRTVQAINLATEVYSFCYRVICRQPRVVPQVQVLPKAIYRPNSSAHRF
jgi:hypothetical protein